MGLQNGEIVVEHWLCGTREFLFLIIAIDSFINRRLSIESVSSTWTLTRSTLCPVECMWHAIALEQLSWLSLSGWRVAPCSCSPIRVPNFRPVWRCTSIWAKSIWAKAFGQKAFGQKAFGQTYAASGQMYDKVPETDPDHRSKVVTTICISWCHKEQEIKTKQQLGIDPATSETCQLPAAAPRGLVTGGKVMKVSGYR